MNIKPQFKEEEARLLVYKNENLKECNINL